MADHKNSSKNSNIRNLRHLHKKSCDLRPKKRDYNFESRSDNRYNYHRTPKFDRYGKRISDERKNYRSYQGFQRNHDLRDKIGYENRNRSGKFDRSENKRKSNNNKKIRGMKWAAQKRDAENQILRQALSIVTQQQTNGFYFNNNAFQAQPAMQYLPKFDTRQATWRF